MPDVFTADSGIWYSNGFSNFSAFAFLRTIWDIPLFFPCSYFPSVHSTLHFHVFSFIAPLLFLKMMILRALRGLISILSR